MPNHVHFIVIPKKQTSLARTFNFTHMRYLWQGSFFSTLLSEEHLYEAVKYVSIL